MGEFDGFSYSDASGDSEDVILVNWVILVNLLFLVNLAILLNLLNLVIFSESGDSCRFMNILF